MNRRYTLTIETELDPEYAERKLDPHRVVLDPFNRDRYISSWTWTEDAEEEHLVFSPNLTSQKSYVKKRTWKNNETS